MAGNRPCNTVTFKNTAKSLLFWCFENFNFRFTDLELYQLKCRFTMCYKY